MPHYKITAQCRTLAPVISSGADPFKFELRASGVKSALRFWWRAFQSERESGALFKREAELFGSTEKASPFRVRLHSDPSTLRILERGDGWPEEWGEGVKYLLFPVLDSTKPGRADTPGGGRRYSLSRPVALPRLEFSLTLDGFWSPKELGEILRALWFFSTLGGLGSRSRRGAGSFQITQIILVQDGAQKKVAETAIDHLDFSCFDRLLGQGDIGEKIGQSIRTQMGTIVSSLPCSKETPRFSAYDRNHSRIYLYFDPRLRSDPLALWNAVGLGMKRGRGNKPSADARLLHTYVEDIQKGSASSDPTRAHPKHAFGLPVQYHFKSDSRNLRSPNLPIGLKATVTDLEGNEARRASPLWISIKHFARIDKNNSIRDSGHFCLMTLLWSEFTGANHRVQWQVTKDKSTFESFMRDNSNPEPEKENLRARVGYTYTGASPSGADFIDSVVRAMGATEITL